ncbi:Ureidoglycolate lyase [compost metagenome]
MQRAKSFDTFLSLGATLTTVDEYASLAELEVETVLNGEVAHRNTVSRMMFSPAYLISFLSHVMTLHPGDIILTGTPGSVVIKQGDKVECRIAGLKTLSNMVET